MSERSDGATLVDRPVRLSGILDHDEAMTSCDLQDRVHVGRESVEMNWDHRPGARPDGRLDRQRVDQEGRGIRSDRDNGRPHSVDGQPGRDEGMSRHDDLVAGPDPRGSKGEFEGIKPIRDPDRVVRSDIAAHSASKAATSGPRTYRPESSTRAIAASMSARSSAVAASKSRYGIILAKRRTRGTHRSPGVVTLVVVFRGQYEAHGS